MNARDAAALLLRLQAHWPSLAVEEAAAADWLRVLSRLDLGHATRTADRLIDDWTQPGSPKIGHWQDYARAALPRPEPTVAVPAAPVTAAERERVDALIREARDALVAKAPR